MKQNRRNVCIMMCVFAALMSFYSAVSCLAAESAVSSSVPAEASDLAAEVLETEWKVSGSYHRDATGLPREELKQAWLGVPFIECELRGHNIDDFLSSNQDDFRVFAGVTKYCFPVFVDKETEPLGAIIIIRNRDENGKKFWSESGEFQLYGYHVRGEQLVNDAVRLHGTYRSEVSVVWFQDTPVPRRFVIERGTEILSGSSADELASILGESRRIRESIASYRAQVRDLQDRIEE